MDSTPAAETMPVLVARILTERGYVLVSPKTYASESSAIRFGCGGDARKRPARLGTAGKWTAIANIRPDDVTRIDEGRITIPLAVFDIEAGGYLREATRDAVDVVRDVTREVWRSPVHETISVHEAIDGFAVNEGDDLRGTSESLERAIRHGECLAENRANA